VTLSHQKAELNIKLPRIPQLLHQITNTNYYILAITLLTSIA